MQHQVHFCSNAADAQASARKVQPGDFLIVLAGADTKVYVASADGDAVDLAGAGYMLPAAAVDTLGGVMLADTVDDAGALTDDSGGTDGDGTIAEVTDAATAADAIATLAAAVNANADVINAVKASLQASGVMAPDA